MWVEGSNPGLATNFVDSGIAEAAYRTDLYAFVWRVFDELHPGGSKVFIPNWHVQAMCFELERLRAGENQHLVITVPPRHLKSITTSVAFCAFLLGHAPSCKIIVASYGGGLARKHSSDCRQVMERAWYRKVFLPREAPWLAEFRRELQGFPRGRHDDQVDSFSQFLNWSIGIGFWRSLDREHPLRRERRNRFANRRR